MKVSRGASQSLQQAQAQRDAKNTKSSKLDSNNKGIESAMSAQVNLSSQARQIKAATELAKQDSVDEKKIAHFQNLIDSGKYQIDAGAIADKLLDEHSKMPT